MATIICEDYLYQFSKIFDILRSKDLPENIASNWKVSHYARGKNPLILIARLNPLFQISSTRCDYPYLLDANNQPLISPIVNTVETRLMAISFQPGRTPNSGILVRKYNQYLSPEELASYYARLVKDKPPRSGFPPRLITSYTRKTIKYSSRTDMEAVLNKAVDELFSELL